MSILDGRKYTEKDIQPLFPNTTWHVKEMNLPVLGHIAETTGYGALPFQQAATVNALGAYKSGFAGYKATATHGTRADLMVNLQNGIPTIVTIALTPENGWGHALVVVGYDPDTGELQFFNPASGNIESESVLLSIDQYNPGNKYSTFDELWAAENVLIQGGNNMVTIAKPSASFPTGGGGGGRGGIARNVLQ